MTMVKTLVALATERMLLKTSGPTFLRGIEFMYAAGLAPDRLSVMMTSSHKFVLQFHSKCDIRPFAANYPNFGRVLRGIVHVREWRIKSIEFVNVAFYMRDVDNLERAIEKLGVELVLLRNCTYPGVQRGDEAVKFLSALNRKKQAVVCEYGDDRLKHRIGRRSSGNRVRRASRNGQDVVVPLEPVEIPVPAAVAPPEPDNEREGVEAFAEQDEGMAAAEANADGPPDAREQDVQEEANMRVEAAPNARADAQIMAVQQQQHQIQAPLALRPVPMAQEPIGYMIPRNIPSPQPQHHQPGHYQRLQQMGRAGAVAAQQRIQQQQPQRQAAMQQQHQIEGPPQNAQGEQRRVAVGAHVYEFRPVDVPNADNVPAVNNLHNLLNVLTDNPNEVRVIVLPRDGQPINLNNINNNGVVYRHHSVQAPPPPPQLQPPMAYQYAQQPQWARQGAEYYPPAEQQQPGPPQMYRGPYMGAPGAPSWNAYPQGVMPQVIPHALMVPVPVPMFGGGVAVNEPQVHRNGGDSNDSTDRDEVMFDPEQRRQENFRELAADQEAQPNFAPVEAQAVELEMLEEGEEEEDEVEENEESSDEEDDVMEDGEIRQNFIIEEQPIAD